MSRVTLRDKGIEPVEPTNEVGEVAEGQHLTQRLGVHHRDLAAVFASSGEDQVGLGDEVRSAIPRPESRGSRRAPAAARSSRWRCRSRSMNGEQQMLPVHTIRIRASSPMIRIRSAGGDEQGGEAPWLGRPRRCCGDIVGWRRGNSDRVGQLVFVERPFTAGGAAPTGVMGPIVVAVDATRCDDVDGLGCRLAGTDELADANADYDHDACGRGDNQEQPQERRSDGPDLVTQKTENVHAAEPLSLGRLFVNRYVNKRTRGGKDSVSIWSSLRQFYDNPRIAPISATLPQHRVPGCRHLSSATLA